MFCQNVRFYMLMSVIELFSKFFFKNISIKINWSQVYHISRSDKQLRLCQDMSQLQEPGSVFWTVECHFYKVNLKRYFKFSFHTNIGFTWNDIFRWCYAQVPCKACSEAENILLLSWFLLQWQDVSKQNGILINWGCTGWKISNKKKTFKCFND